MIATIEAGLPSPFIVEAASNERDSNAHFLMRNDVDRELAHQELVIGNNLDSHFIARERSSHTQEQKMLRMLLSWTAVSKIRYNEQSAYMIRRTTLQSTQEIKDRLGGKLEVVQASNMGGEQVNNQSNAWLLHYVAPRARKL